MKISPLAAAIALLVVATPGFGGAKGAPSLTPASCPRAASTLTASTNKLAQRMLVPPGATTVLLCRYRGLNPSATAHRLQHSRRVTSTAQVARFTTELDALPKLGRVIHCPMDDGSEITATFGYRSAASVYLDVGLTGCRTVSNGHLTRTASSPGGSRLIDQLTSLLP
jgi:hypothetical protein